MGLDRKNQSLGFDFAASHFADFGHLDFGDSLPAARCSALPDSGCWTKNFQIGPDFGDHSRNF